jgi:hypothetical protein
MSSVMTFYDEEQGPNSESNQSVVGFHQLSATEKSAIIQPQLMSHLQFVTWAMYLCMVLELKPGEEAALTARILLLLLLTALTGTLYFEGKNIHDKKNYLSLDSVAFVEKVGLTPVFIMATLGAILSWETADTFADIAARGVILLVATLAVNEWKKYADKDSSDSNRADTFKLAVIFTAAISFATFGLPGTPLYLKLISAGLLTGTFQGACFIGKKMITHAATEERNQESRGLVIN